MNNKKKIITFIIWSINIILIAVFLILGLGAKLGPQKAPTWDELKGTGSYFINY